MYIRGQVLLSTDRALSPFVTEAESNSEKVFIKRKTWLVRIGRGIVCRRCTDELSAGELHSKRSLQWKDGGENTKGEK